MEKTTYIVKYTRQDSYLTVGGPVMTFMRSEAKANRFAAELTADRSVCSGSVSLDVIHGHFSVI